MTTSQNSWVVRPGVFETNSSSTHSLVISSDPNTLTSFNSEEEIIVNLGGFGWEIEQGFDFDTKASYLLTYAVKYGTPRDVDLLREIIEQYTELPVELQIDDPKDYAHIDHQSVCAPKEMFCNINCRELISDFLFNDSSYLQTDNDNC